MNKFTLKMEQPELNRVVEVSFEEDYLEDVLMQFDMFIRGCGYVPSGHRLDYFDLLDETVESKGWVDTNMSTTSIHINDELK